MLGARHLPTYLDAVNFENDLDKHHRKLGQIQNGQIKRKPLFNNDNTKLVQSRSQNIKFHNSEKHMAIERDNELLLGRLVEISRKKQNPLFAVNEPITNHKSLNDNYRKKEKQRIAAENEAFARRLLSQQPSFNRQKLDNDYEKHASRVKLMQKWMGFSPRIKLPPIKYDKYEDLDRKSQSGKEKRAIKDINKKKRRKSQKVGKLNEDEREEIAEAEEVREKEQEEEEARLREQKEEQEQRERQQREKEEAEQRLAKEQAEKKKKEEEQKLAQQTQQNKPEEQNKPQEAQTEKK